MSNNLVGNPVIGVRFWEMDMVDRMITFSQVFSASPKWRRSEIGKMHLIKKILIIIGAITFMLGTCCAATAAATKLYFSESQDGGKAKCILQADDVEKLAGIKIVVHYPSEIMRYGGDGKTTETNGFMHVVNDKSTGKLIIVMASAKGITGVDLPLIELLFETNHEQRGECALLDIVQCQLLDEDIKNITCSYAASQI